MSFVRPMVMTGSLETVFTFPLIVLYTWSIEHFSSEATSLTVSIYLSVLTLILAFVLATFERTPDHVTQTRFLDQIDPTYT